MTSSSLPVNQATLNAAVQAGAQAAFDRARSTATAPDRMVTWDQLSGHIQRYYLDQYGPVITAALPILAAHVDQRARADERERIAVRLEAVRDVPIKVEWEGTPYIEETLTGAAAIARAGTSGGDCVR